MFSPTTAQDKHDLVATSSDGGAPGSSSLVSSAATASILLSNGRAYTVDLSACRSVALCTSLPPTQFVDVSAQTRIDATPPTGTMPINGGAAFTNNPLVNLSLTATDPLIDGIPGSSSGVSQEAVDPRTGASGIDPALTTWNFSDGTAAATGAKVTHTYAKDGRFVGQLRVRDRAGDVSDVRNFAVTVTPAPGDTPAGGGSLGNVSGKAAFTVSAFTTRARHARSALSGSIRITGSSTQAGALRVEIRRPRAKALIARIRVALLSVGPFVRTVKLSATLLPGRDTVNLVGPGGTLTTTLTLTPPREGVIRSGRITGSRATFVLAARPVKALRTKLSVRWTLGGRTLAVVPVGPGTTIHASLPGGAPAGHGQLVATLRAGSTAIGTAAKRLR